MEEGRVANCPHCLAVIPDAARKCRHCGEWVKEPPPEPGLGRTGEGRGDQSLGRAANGFVTFHWVWAIVVLLVMLVLFFTLFRPAWRSSKRNVDHIFERFGDPGGPRPR